MRRLVTQSDSMENQKSTWRMKMMKHGATKLFQRIRDIDRTGSTTFIPYLRRM